MDNHRSVLEYALKLESTKIAVADLLIHKETRDQETDNSNYHRLFRTNKLRRFSDFRSQALKVNISNFKELIRAILSL